MNTDRFRFRVWDKEEKEYLQEGALIDSRTGFIVGYLDADCFIIEQCTGLPDKNGKLIYEGDVLNVEDYDGSHTMIVAWHDRASCLSLLKQKAGKYAPIWRHLIAFISDELEIIGNIHEMEKDKCSVTKI